ncbi:MAG: ATP-binding cassette domain-containing protein [Chitinophagaceae bacterium]|nr:ATP-binding cassette domain-containing protein [Chitinophagaceae bacterium]
MQFILETSGLTYAFSRKQPVLDNINLQVPEGSIYGFLGPNGAGKTTTLKLILGLLTRQRGDITLWGRSFEKDRKGLLRRLGSFIETPSLYGHLSAMDNLLVWQKIYHCPLENIARALRLVGLTDTGSKKVRQFSFGMKQRLGIAVALLHRPALLVLDEPTNGLDPHGIIDIRELLKTLNREEGITILVSSHLLSEVEKLATHMGIIHHGSMVYQGTLHGLLSRHPHADLEKIFLDTIKLGAL